MTFHFSKEGTFDVFKLFVCQSNFFLRCIDHSKDLVKEAKTVCFEESMSSVKPEVVTHVHGSSNNTYTAYFWH